MHVRGSASLNERAFRRHRIIIRRGRAHLCLPPFSETDGTTMSALYTGCNTGSAHKSCTALCTYLDVAVICTVMIHWYTRGVRRDNCCSPTPSGAAQVSHPVYQTTLSAAVMVGNKGAWRARTLGTLDGTVGAALAACSWLHLPQEGS